VGSDLVSRMLTGNEFQTCLMELMVVVGIPSELCRGSYLLWSKLKCLHVVYVVVGRVASRVVRHSPVFLHSW